MRGALPAFQSASKHGRRPPAAVRRTGKADRHRWMEGRSCVSPGGPVAPAYPFNPQRTAEPITSRRFLRRLAKLRLPRRARMTRRSRLSTVGREQPRRAAISSFVYPSNFSCAIDRASSSGSSPSKRRNSSAVCAANSGVGSVPTTPSQPRPVPSAAWSNTESPRTFPPPRMGLSSHARWSDAFRTVITTNNRHRVVVAVIQPREPTLFGAAAETVGGPTPRPPRPRPAGWRRREPVAGQGDEAAEIAFPKLLGGGEIAGLELRAPSALRIGLPASAAPVAAETCSGTRPIVRPGAAGRQTQSPIGRNHPAYIDNNARPRPAARHGFPAGLRNARRTGTICSLDSARRRVVLAVGHGDAVLVAEQPVDRDGVVERLPALRPVLRAAGNQERPRRHQGVQVRAGRGPSSISFLYGPVRGFFVVRDARLAARGPARIPDTTAPSSSHWCASRRRRCRGRTRRRRRTCRRGRRRTSPTCRRRNGRRCRSASDRPAAGSPGAL